MATTRLHPTQPPAAILFDVDGTLITTGGAGAVAWRLAFEELYGLSADIEMFADVGMADPEVGRLTFAAVVGREPAPSELARLLAIRLKHLPGTLAESEGFRVLDGVSELLPSLVDEGRLVGLTTGGTDTAAHIKLAHGNLARWFTFGGYGSDSTDRTALTRKAIERGERLIGHALDPRQVLVVGDTPRDVAAAHGVGAVAVAVASGHYSAEELTAAGADHVLASLRQPLPLVSAEEALAEPALRLVA
jgi:phosphoglycolate phosphatase